MTTKAGNGTIDKRGDGFRLRYRVNGERFTKTVRVETLKEARTELRRLLTSADDGNHIAPNKITLKQWTDEWFALLERGAVTTRTLEMYRGILTLYVIPKLGERMLHTIEPTEIDRLYAALETTPQPNKHKPASAWKPVSGRTVHHVHIVLGACIKAAVKKRLLARNPVSDATAPAVGQSEAGQALDPAQLTALLENFHGSSLYPIVATLAHTGMRRGEVLALRWCDLDLDHKKISITRALDETQEFGRRIKAPKTRRGVRTITIDDDLVKLLRAEHEHHLRIVAGVSDGVPVLSSVRLPPDALVFPSPIEPFDFTRLRDPHAVTREFTRRARRLGFEKLRLHDLRHSHGSMLLSAGMPIHTVAARLGHDPAVLMRVYAHATAPDDAAAADAVGRMMKGTA